MGCNVRCASNSDQIIAPQRTQRCAISGNRSAFQRHGNWDSFGVVRCRGIAFEKMYCAGGVGRILPNGTESGGCGAMEVFEEIFEDLEDPRTGNAKRHELHEILVIGFCTLLSGGETCADMALFGRSKLEFLQEFLRLEHGVPSHDTFSRVFRLLDPDRFHAWFIGFMRGFAETCQGVVAIDGKTLRRSFDRAAAASPLHLVSAWAVDQRLVLGQLAVGDKSNEIVAVPKLLELLSLKGRIITADAMSCQRKIAQQVVDQGADYVLALKGNQETLHDDVRRFLDDPDILLASASELTYIRKDGTRFPAVVSVTALRDAQGT